MLSTENIQCCTWHSSTDLIGDLLSCLAHVQLLCSCRHTRRSASQSSRSIAYPVAAAHNVLQLHGSAAAATATAAAASDCKQRPATSSGSSTTGMASHPTRARGSRPAQSQRPATPPPTPQTASSAGACPAGERGGAKQSNMLHGGFLLGCSAAHDVPSTTGVG